MPRKVPDAPDFHKPTSTHEEITLHLKTITPYFGGGYEPRQIAEDYPVRAASIRGHLRFWWRATAGAQYNTPQALHDAESKLWGSAAKPSKNGEIEGGPGKVSLIVTRYRGDDKVRCAEYVPTPKGGLRVDFDKYPGYALFPFQGEAKDGKVITQPDFCIPSLDFHMGISFPNTFRNEIESALAMWIKYGGVGARTRRGCGSLQSNFDVQAVLATYVSSLEYPVISGSKYVVGRLYDTSLEAWKEAITVYSRFRQQRKRGDNRPGRSYWPEPDSIRRISRRASRGHEPQHEVQLGFPRADLGLPIIFHFKDKKYGDPEDTNLEGFVEGLSRFASPVITKAVPLGNGKYAPLVLILNAPHAWSKGNLSLNGHTIEPEVVKLTTKERQLIEPLKGATVREALLKYVAQQWGMKVEVIL